jgi:hypothetical protein
MDKKQKIRVRVYFNQDSFKAIALEAEKAGFRRGGLQIFNQREHGFAGQVDANTDGISKYLKHCQAYYVAHEAQRLQELAEIAMKERDIAERKKRLGGAL